MNYTLPKKARACVACGALIAPFEEWARITRYLDADGNEDEDMASVAAPLC